MIYHNCSELPAFNHLRYYIRTLPPKFRDINFNFPIRISTKVLYYPKQRRLEMFRSIVSTSRVWQRCIRLQSTKATIGKPFKTTQEIAEYLSTPSWSVDDLLKDSKDSNRASSIDHNTVEKLLKLSGLEAKKGDYDELVETLKSQVVFIDHLHSIPDTQIIKEKKNANTQKGVSLEDLEKQIQLQRPDPEKGEVSGSWDPMSLAQESLNGQYIVREGLIKNK